MKHRKRKVQVSIRLEAEMINEMEAVCEIFSINRTALIERSVREFIVRWWQREGQAIIEFEKYRKNKLRDLNK